MEKDRKKFELLKNVKELGLIGGINCYIEERRRDKYISRVEEENRKAKERKEIEDKKEAFVRKQKEQLQTEEELINKEKNMYRSK